MKQLLALAKFSSRDRKIMGGLVLLLVAGPLVMFVFPVQFENLEAVRKQLKYQINLIKTREDKITRLMSIKKQYYGLTGEVKRAREMFFNNKETSDFLKGINDLAERETGNNLLMMEPLYEKNIEPLTPENGSDDADDSDGFFYNQKVIRLAVEGSFRSIEDLIRRFDSYKKLIRVESIKIEQSSKASKVRAQIELAMYIMSEGEAEKTQEVD